MQHLRYFKYFIGIVGNAFQCFQLQDFSEQMPQTLCGALSCVGIAANDLIEYVVCPSWHSLYIYNYYKDCIAMVGGEKVSKNCCRVPYPKHPHRSRHQKCGATLLKKVRSGRVHRLVPNEVIPYFPLLKSMRRLAFRPGFVNM